DQREVIEDMQVAQIDYRRWIFWQAKHSGLGFDLNNTPRGFACRFAAEDGRHEHPVTTFTQTEVPPPRVATEPRSVDLGRQLFGLCEPVVVEVEPLFEVDVEEVIGHRHPSRGPTAYAIVKTALEVGAVLVEMDECGVALLHPASVNALGGDVELTRKPDTQSGQSLNSLRKHCHTSQNFFHRKLAKGQRVKPMPDQSFDPFTPWPFAMNQFYFLSLQTPDPI